MRPEHDHTWTRPILVTDDDIYEPGVPGIITGRCHCGAIEYVPDLPPGLTLAAIRAANDRFGHRAGYHAANPAVGCEECRA